MYMGLTGGIASGKNQAAAFFAELGCYTIDADLLSRAVMQRGHETFDAIIARFGSDILTDDGEIDRGALRRKVISSPDDLAALESIIHPAVIDMAFKEYGAIKGRDDKAIVIFNAPLLIEAGALERYDAIITVWCSKENQLAHIKKRGYPPYEDSLKLLDAQLSHEERLKYTSYVINNDSSIDNLKNEVERVYNLLRLTQYCEKKV